LTERAFGLTGTQGNHVKEYWWYLDAIPATPGTGGVSLPAGLDPGPVPLPGAHRRQRGPEPAAAGIRADRHLAFDNGRYWIVEVAYAKAGPDDLLMTISVTKAGPDAENLHVLPTA
jgi:hypothetical protein